MLARISHVARRVPTFSRARARAPTCAAPLERRVRVTCIKGAKREMVILTSRKTDDTGERRERDELAADKREDDRKTRSSGSHISFRRRANYYRIVHSSLLAPALVSGNSCTSRLHVNGTCRSVVGLARNLAPVFPRPSTADRFARSRRDKAIPLPIRLFISSRVPRSILVSSMSYMAQFQKREVT